MINADAVRGSRKALRPPISRQALRNLRVEACLSPKQLEESMNGLIYLVGLIVVIMFILSLLGLR
jgi:hypothetical protein